VSKGGPFLKVTTLLEGRGNSRVSWKKKGAAKTSAVTSSKGVTSEWRETSHDIWESQIGLLFRQNSFEG